MKKIGVIIKEPGKKPRHVNISDTSENLQRTVSGYIETVTIASDAVIICDEEGRIKGKPHCCAIGNIDFCGTVIICGVNGDEFTDVPLTYQQVKRLFPGLWENCNE